jgi:hypothetical protein
MNYADAALFALSPMAAVAAALGKAVAYVGLQTETARKVEGAIAIARANIAIIGSLLAAVRDGTAPDPDGALQSAKRIALDTIAVLKEAARSVPGAPLEILDALAKTVGDVAEGIDHAIRETADKVKDLAADAAKVVVPFELINLALTVGAVYLGWRIFVASPRRRERRAA